MTWNFHVDKFANSMYYMIPDIDLLIELVFNLKLCEHLIKEDDKPLKGSSSPMIDLGTYKFNDLNTGKIKLKSSIINTYVERYISQKLSVLILNDYVYSYMLKTKKQIEIK